MPKVDTTKCRVRFCPYVPTSRQDLNAHVDQAHRNACDELVCSLCPTYATTQMSNLNSHLAAVHNPEKQRFLCPVEGCGKSQASQRHLDDHIAKKHRGEGYMSCPVENCTFQSQYANVLEMHITSVHCDDRPFVCSFDGCDYAAKRHDSLQSHMRKHTGAKPYVCTFDGCNKTFAFRQSLKQHSETHVPVKPWLSCSVCVKPLFRTKRPSRLREHMNEVHFRMKPYSCPMEGCAFTTARKGAVRQHVNAIHEKQETYECSVDGCDFVTLWPFILQKHTKYNHAKTGERVRNGQEHQFLRALGAHFELEQPYAIRKEFLSHCRRKFIHVDAAISIPERELLVLIECDEQQHKDQTLYSVHDELTRMQDATQGIRAAGIDAHVLWIRFNPDTYTVDSAGGCSSRMNDATEARVTRLIEFISEFVPADNITDQDMTIAYFYYDVVDSVAAVTQQPEYFEELRACAVSVF